MTSLGYTNEDFLSIIYGECNGMPKKIIIKTPFNRALFRFLEIRVFWYFGVYLKNAQVNLRLLFFKMRIIIL